MGADRSDSCVHERYVGYQRLDLTDASETASVISEAAPDYIVNLAAVSSVGASWRDPRLTMQVNVMGTVNVLEAARTLPRTPRILLVGSSEEYLPKNGPLSEGDPIDATNPYGISKATQERVAQMYAREWGMQVLLTRSFNHTGPGQSSTFVVPSWCRQVADIEGSGHAGTMRVGNLAVERDISDVRDVVRAYRMILEGGVPGRAYNVGSGVATPLKTVLSIICDLTEQKVDVEVDPALLRPNDTPSICADISRIADELGWKPEIRLDRTLADTYRAFLG